MNKEEPNTIAYAELLIRSDELTTDEISNLLAVKPTKAAENKDKCMDWCYSTRKYKTFDVSPILDEIYEKFKNLTIELHEIRCKYNATIYIEIVVEYGSHAPGFFIDQKFIKFAYDIGAGIDIDTYLMQRE